MLNVSRPDTSMIHLMCAAIIVFPESLLHGLLKRLRRVVDESGERIDRGRHRSHAALSLGEASLLESLSNLRHRLHTVAGVETRRVDLMLEPVTTRQTIAVTKLLLRRQQCFVQLLKFFSRKQGLRVRLAYRRVGLLELLRSGLQGFDCRA